MKWKLLEHWNPQSTWIVPTIIQVQKLETALFVSCYKWYCNWNKIKITTMTRSNSKTVSFPIVETLRILRASLCKRFVCKIAYLWCGSIFLINGRLRDKTNGTTQWLLYWLWWTTKTISVTEFSSISFYQIQIVQIKFESFACDNMRTSYLNSILFLSQSLHTIPCSRKVDLCINLHFLVSGSRYRYLHRDFALKVASSQGFRLRALHWCCRGKKMAIYFNYLCTVTTAIVVSSR